jgi:hypothetical protein
MTARRSSQFITIDLGPTYGSDIDRIRNGQISWLDDMDGTDDPIFTVKIPLELVGVSPSESESVDTEQTSPTSLEFTQCGDVTVQGVQPDSYTLDILCAGGGMNMSVDSLSRSILLTDVDERTFIDKLKAQTDIDAAQLDALRRKLLVPSLYAQHDNSVATRATTMLKKNIRRHEHEHVRCLIDPTTALWHELELYWRSIFVCADRSTWTDTGFLRRLIALYTTPSRFTVELIAMLSEDYATDNPAVRRAISTSVSAHRGAEGLLGQITEGSNIDDTALSAVLRSPMAEQYCDLWLAYVLDEVRSGVPLGEIDAADFHNTYDSMAPLSENVCDSETRSDFIDVIRARCYGPVFELVRLKFEDGFVLERTWYSLNPEVTASEQCVAVRRTLFRRAFLSRYNVESGLQSVLKQRESAVKDIINGASLTEASLFDVPYPSPKQLTGHLTTAYDTTATALFGPRSAKEEVHAWLNDPECCL